MRPLPATVYNCMEHTYYTVGYRGYSGNTYVLLFISFCSVNTTTLIGVQRADMVRFIPCAEYNDRNVGVYYMS
jgi:hypothetical protein